MNKRPMWQWVLVAVLLGVVLDWWIQRPDAATRAINEALQAQASAEMKAYSYHFQVLRVQGDVALLSTPRNAQVPALHFIRVIHPEINVMNANDGAFIAAEKHLALLSMQARAIVLAQPGIKDVRWELDRRWLTAHGVTVPDTP